MSKGFIFCEACGEESPRRGTVQKYCEPCSERMDLQRKKLWARGNPPDSADTKRWRAAKRSRAIVAGQEKSAEVSNDIGWNAKSPDLLWLVRIAVPFQYAASKNAIYTTRRNGHVALRRESRAIRDEITLRIKNALIDQPVAHNRLWLDIYVQKPNHRGDAINVLDLVCDAVKDAVPVDDRWFAIRQLNWEVAKNDPMIFVGIGQDTTEDAQVCSYCGMILPFSSFRKSSHSKIGVGRECKDCLRIKRVK